MTTMTTTTTTTTTATATKRRTITLTGRAPVAIDDADWPVVAAGDDREHDGLVECQANRKWACWLKVRAHADGRAIVYGAAIFDSGFPRERDYAERAGVLLPARDILGDPMGLARAIALVAESLVAAAEDQRERIERCARECVASLPAEAI